MADLPFEDANENVEATGIWSLAVAEGLPGLKAHCALATEKGVVSDAPTASFLTKILGGVKLDPVGSPLAAPEALALSRTK